MDGRAASKTLTRPSCLVTISTNASRRALGRVVSLGICAVLASGLIGVGVAGENSGPSSTRAFDDPKRMPSTQLAARLDEEEGDSLGWFILRQWNAGPLLQGLAPRLRLAVADPQRDEPFRTGGDGSGQVDVDLVGDGPVPGEITVGLFTDPSYSTRPIQVRSFPRPGRYHIDKIPTGEVYIGAMVAQGSGVTALGVHHDWPRPVPITTQPQAIAVLISKEFFEHASGTYGYVKNLEPYTGEWKVTRPTNVLKGRTLDHAGHPVPFALIQIREFNPGAGSIAAPDTVSNYRGEYCYDKMDWPYTVSALRYELLPDVIGCRCQFRACAKVLKGARRLDFRFPAWPSGKATITGRVVDDRGKPLKRFFLRAGTWPEYYSERKESQEGYSDVIEYHIPVLSENGIFKLGGLSAGKYSISVIPFAMDDYESDRGFDKDLADGQTIEVKLTVAAKTELYARVLFDDGTPVYPTAPPWSGAKAFINCRGGSPISDHGGKIDRQGYVAIRLEREELPLFEDGRASLELMWPAKENGSYYPIGTIPFDKLSPARRRAGIITISREALKRAR